MANNYKPYAGFIHRMSAAAAAKQCGMKSLKEMAEYVSYSTVHLNNIYKKDKSRFELLLRVAACEKIGVVFGNDFNSRHFSQVCESMQSNRLRDKHR